ncbi:phage tail tape measure protein, partial [Escherichia albertii]|nr:phage tail tape measure protein [Escherichia albertii]MCU7287731.1 phage tail tape measure protein [Escherichia albertii]
ATLQADLEKASEMAAKDRAESEASRLKYTEEAQKAYERLQTPLEKYTARQEDSAHAALLTLQAELRTLEKHAGANEKISQQRRDLW